jgi:hypothetical protein
MGEAGEDELGPLSHDRVEEESPLQRRLLSSSSLPKTDDDAWDPPVDPAVPLLGHPLHQHYKKYVD